MNQRARGLRGSTWMVAIGGAVAAAAMGVASGQSAQAVQGGDATCDASDVSLSAVFQGTTIVDLAGGTGDVGAPNPDNGTNTNGGALVVGGGGTSVAINLLRCDATRAAEFLSAEAEIVDGAVTIGGNSVATLGAVTSEVLCPAAGTGAPSSSASAELSVGGEAINLSAGETEQGFVDFAIPGVDGIITVTATSSATSDADSAAATGLALSLSFSGAALGQSVAFELGTIMLAETACVAGAADQAPTTPDPDQVTICHATGLAATPYTQITVSESAVEEGAGHNSDDHQNGDDIIPPGDYDPDGRNWDAAGQAIHANGCVIAAPPTPTTPTTPAAPVGPAGEVLPSTR